MSSIDGRKVRYMDDHNWLGLVIGDSHTEGFVRVDWEKPNRQIGIHRIQHLTVLDDAPSQTDLANQYYGRSVTGAQVPFHKESTDDTARPQ